MRKQSLAMPGREMIEKCDEVSRLLKALAHPQRLHLLCLLAEKERTVGDLEDLTGASQPVVSQFLNRMKLEGLLGSDRRGSFVFYRIVDKRVLRVLKGLNSIFCK